MQIYIVSTVKFVCSIATRSTRWNVLVVELSSRDLTDTAESILFSRSVGNSGTWFAIVANARSIAKECGIVGSTFVAWQCQMS